MGNKTELLKKSLLTPELFLITFCYMKTLREKFFAKISVASNGCVLWCGCSNSSDPEGYGRMKAEGKLRLAHHVSWFLKYSVWPKRLRHTCDTPRCVKIGHLREGSQFENMQDKVERGRQLKGDEIAQAKLTIDQVREIRRLCVETSMTYQEIGDRFEIEAGTVWNIHDRRAWAWLDPHVDRRRKMTKGDTVRAIAEAAGVSYATVAERMKRGLTGAALMAGRHQGPRKPYGSGT